MTKLKTISEIEKEFRKTIRYNSKEFRLERRAPVYDENEKYTGHVWLSLVSEDIFDFYRSQIQSLLEGLKGEEREITTMEDRVFKSLYYETSGNRNYNQAIKEQNDKIERASK
jgi:hypothetical protein